MRIYTWEPSSVSIGYFQKISDVVDSLGLNGTEKNCDIVRRPTGGTAVVHDSGPSFSLSLKDGLRTPSTRINITELYSMLGRCVVEALHRLNVPADVWNGPKGNSNYSSLCISSLCPYDVVSNGRKVAGYAARRLRGATLLQGYISLPDGLTTRELRGTMIAAVEGVTGVRLLDGTLTEEERTLVAKLRNEKYTRREWNYKR
jgi:lipoate-protein ligase A